MSLNIINTISLQQQAITGAFHLCLTSLHSCALHLQSYRNHVQEHVYMRPQVKLKKDCYFLKIIKQQYKLVRNFKRGKLVSYFPNNAAKTCLYGLKISENIEIKQAFQSKDFFHLSGNLHTSCSSAFNRGFMLVGYLNNLRYYVKIEIALL